MDKKILATCFIGAVFMLFVESTHAEKALVSTLQVAEQIYMISGEGGNVGLFVGEDGTFLIDDQFAALTEALVAAIETVGGSHPKFLVNTHYHGDHTGGNENFGRRETLIFAHENVRERLFMGSFVKEFDMKVAGLAEAGLPVVTFAEGVSFHLNGDTIEVIHVPHAHTDGDSFVHFKAANVIHAGDIFFNGFYPFIDVNHGGSLKGMIKAVDKILTLSDDQTKIISGHGPLGDKAQLKNYRQMLGTAYKSLRKLKSEGKSPQEAAAAKPLEDLEATWGHGIFTGDRWIYSIYSGV